MQTKQTVTFQMSAQEAEAFHDDIEGNTMIGRAIRNRIFSTADEIHTVTITVDVELLPEYRAHG